MITELKDRQSRKTKYPVVHLKRIKSIFSLLKKRDVIVSLAVFFVSLCVFSAVGIFSRNTPYIFSISPEVAMPDELLTVRGLFFGKERGTTSVYFSDLKVPGSAYEKWSSREIVLRVPEGVDVGQVRVRNSYGFSNGILFTGQDAIPVIAEEARVPAEPPLTVSLTPAEPVAGEEATLTGRGFGEAGAVERVNFFSGDGRRAEILSADALLWSAESVRFVMPDGFPDGGFLTVSTRYGESEPFEFRSDISAVKMIFGESRKVQAELSVSAVNNAPQREKAVFVLPTVPAGFRQQPAAQKGGRPLFAGGREFRLFEDEIKAGGRGGARLPVKVVLKSVAFEPVKEAFSADCGGRSDEERTDPLFKPLADEFVSGRMTLAAFVAELRRLFDENFRFERIPAAGNRAAERPPFAESRTGNAFEFAALFAETLESAGVRAEVVSGYYLTEADGAVEHAWVRYRYPRFGFIDTDPTAAQNGFGDRFVEQHRAAAGAVSSRYWEIFDGAYRLPRQFYRGFPVAAADGVFSRQQFYAETAADSRHFEFSEPTVTGVKFR